MTKRFICRAGDIPANGMKECEAEGGLKLLVANAGGEFFAYQAICPHQDVALCEGLYDGSILTCHMHLWQWDIKSGSPVGLAETALERYNLSMEGDSLFVESKSAIDVGELFTGASEATLAKLAALARGEEYDQGAVIYGVGDPAEDFFVLDSGRVEFRIGRDERTSPAGFMLRKGEVFGWAALLDSHPRRIASARAVERSAVLRIDGRQTLGALEADPASGYLVMKRLSALIARYLAESGAK
ncbi:MAG TPA: cyclic nucleotide-binding domain-containing protein [Burkholderiales bacterium]|nr:cyclic nucleotide-binding domain-containing protein [Burkholderiales bacterium]